MVRKTLVYLALLLVCAPVASGQATIYWKKDHIYAGAEGKEIAVVTPTPSDTTAPAAPSGVTLGTVTATSVSLSWSASTDSGGSGLAGYKVYRQTGTGASLPVGTEGPSTVAFTDQPLQPSTSYTYTVVAFDNAENHSSASGSVNTTTLSSSTDTIAPSVPIDVVGIAPTSTTVNLTWAASTDAGGSGVAGYTVYRGGVLVSGGSLLTSPSFNDSGLSANTTYSYTVTATDNAGNTSSASTAASVTTTVVLLSDNFNRADASTLGSPWTSYSYPTSYPFEILAYTAIAMPPSAYTWINTVDSTSQTDFNATVQILSGNNDKGIIFWSSTYGARYRAVVNSSTVELLYSPDGWTDWDDLGTVLATASGTSTPCTLTVQAISSTRVINVYQNGSLMISYTETDYTRPNSGQVGMTAYFYPSTAVPVVMDNFYMVQP